MKENKLQARVILNAVHAVLIVAAVVLSFISSSKAYNVSNINTLLVYGIAAAVINVVAIFLTTKGQLIITDICIWASVILSMLLMCGMINGRLKLMGYVWFSDLESGNPVAVGALNLTVAAWICIVLGIICLCIIGFKQEKR